MEEQELYSVLESFKNAIDVIQARQEELDKMYHDSIEQFDERFHNLESTLYDEILTPANEALEARALEDEFEAYKGKYGERLGAYNDKLSPLEGEDFDLTKKAFDQWKEYTPQEGDEGFDEAGYVDALIEHVEEQLKAMKEIVGAEDKEITATVDENGNTEIDVDGETVAADAEEKTEEAPAEETDEAEESFADADDEDLTPEQEAEIQKQLEAEMKAEGLI